MPCSNCPFRTDGNQCTIGGPGRWDNMKAHILAGNDMQCHEHITPDDVNVVMRLVHDPNKDWHLDYPATSPCSGAEAYREAMQEQTMPPLVSAESLGRLQAMAGAESMNAALEQCRCQMLTCATCTTRSVETEMVCEGCSKDCRKELLGVGHVEGCPTGLKGLERYRDWVRRRKGQ